MFALHFGGVAADLIAQVQRRVAGAARVILKQMVRRYCRKRGMDLAFSR